MFHGLPVAPCSHWALWLLGSQWFLKLLEFLVVPCGFLWLLRCRGFPVVSRFLVPCSSSGSSSYLWFLVVPWISSRNLWFLKLSMLPVAYGSTGCLWFLVVPQVPRVTCGSLWAFFFLRLLRVLWFLGFAAVPMVSQVPQVPLDYLWFFGSI